MNTAVLVALLSLLLPIVAPRGEPCRVFCTPKFKVEPAITTTNLFRPTEIVTDNGGIVRERRAREFETILSVSVPTRAEWFELTIEASFQPFDRDRTPELEFEANLIWLPSSRTRGWLTSHVDVVDKFSPAERPTDRRAYTHKLNLELDTALAIFQWLPAGRWLRGVELEGSLDYVATGLPRKGDRTAAGHLLQNGAAWSFSVVLVLPIAPM